MTIKADRADGFVLRNVTARHAAEHDVYVLETDGYLLKENKYIYAGEYGTLTFTSDHGVTRHLRGEGQRRLGRLPGRRAGHGGGPGRHELLPAAAPQPD